MVIADFNLVCIGEREPEFLKIKSIGADIFGSKYEKGRHCGYGSHWGKLKVQNSIWYQFYPIVDCNEDARNYNDEFFDLRIKKNKYILVPLIAHSKDVLHIIDFYIKKSPIGEVLVLFRLDETGESSYIEQIGYTDFADRFEKQKLKFNRIYRIEK